MAFIILLILLTINLLVCDSFIVKNIIKNRYLYCINNSEMTDDTISYTSNGKERRALRAIANRMKQDASLLTLPGSISYNENFIKNVKESLEAKEMILLKFNDSGKKKEVKQIMMDICKLSKSEIIQVVGHTALIFKEKSKSSIIRKAINEELVRTKDT